MVSKPRRRSFATFFLLRHNHRWKDASWRGRQSGWLTAASAHHQSWRDSGQLTRMWSMVSSCWSQISGKIEHQNILLIDGYISEWEEHKAATYIIKKSYNETSSVIHAVLNTDIHTNPIPHHGKLELWSSTHKYMEVQVWTRENIEE